MKPLSISELQDIAEKVSVNAGMSICPICQRKWLVTPMNDCCLPACGCFGSDTSSVNPDRPCEPCGIYHFLHCRDNAHDQAPAEELKQSINNDNAMKNLDRHFEQRGGCFDERDRYEE